MRISVRSLAFSWLFALGMLGILLAGTPSLSHSGTPDVIDLPPHLTPASNDQLAQLQSTVWCALESSRSVRLTLDGRTLQYQGAMAIAPNWDGNVLPAAQQQRVDTCVQQRLRQLTGATPEGQRAALTFLFTKL